MLAALHRFEDARPLPDAAALNIRDAAVKAWLDRLWADRKPYHAWLGLWRHFAAWEGSFLDIGANVGQSIVSFALFNPRMRILSFEPNPLCAAALAHAAALVPNSVEVFLCGLDEEDAAPMLHVPVLAGGDSFGPSSNASLRRSELDKPHVVARLLAGAEHGTLGVVEVPATVRRPDALPLPDDVRLVKIDVEGFERHVLEGLTPLIRRQRPVMTVERNNWPEIAAWLAREDYAAFDHDEATATLTRVPDGPRGGALVDPLLLPLERIDQLLAEAPELRLAPA